MKNSNKKLLSLVFLLAFSLISLSIISGATVLSADNITIVIPASSGNLSGTASVFNCSLVAGYEAENWTRVRVYLQSVSKTANTTEALVTGWITNTTAYALNGTVNTIVVEDGNDYTFKCQVWNGTNFVNKTRSGITIDNTIPQAPSITSHTNNQIVSNSNAQTFTYTVVNSNTTSCSYTLYRYGSGSDAKSVSGTGTYLGSSCSFTKSFTDSSFNGNWDLIATASDETNSTASSTTTLQVQLAGSGGGGTQPSGDGIFVDSSKIIWIILGLLLVGFIVYMLIKN